MSIDLIGGHTRTVQHLPIGSLKFLGENPYAEAMFRVIWSESRYYLVGANHTSYDGDPSTDVTVKARGKDPNASKTEQGYKWLPLYPGRGRWILEMWKSPMGFTGCTPEQYEILYRDPVSHLLTLGPYPNRGEFCQCCEFPQTPTISTVVEQIHRIKAGWNYSYAEKKVANDLAEAKKEKEKFSQFEAMFKDSQQAFNNNPSNIRPGKRTKERVNISKTAKEAGINTRGAFSSGTSPQAILNP